VNTKEVVANVVLVWSLSKCSRNGHIPPVQIACLSSTFD